MSPKVRELIEKMLERDYTKRFRTAEDLKNYMLSEGLA